MIDSLKTGIGRLRLMGILEGASLLILLFICVPMKHMAGNPMGSEIVGPIHGIFFILYIIFLFQVKSELNWPWNKTIIAIIGCFIPFGTFYVNAKILPHTVKS